MGDAIDRCIIITECIHRNVQLVDRRNEYEGKVEVCDGGEGKSVCDRMWGEEEAMVVCRQLNYSDISSTLLINIASAATTNAIL